MRFSNKPSIYFIMGSQSSGARDPFQVLEEALKGGISHFQLREKGVGALTGSALLEFALRCQQLCGEYGVPFIINDQVELACRIGADGIHIGQDDAAASQVRQRIGEDKILGVSVHSVQEAEIASKDGADYVGMGPIFGTMSKADAKKPAGVKKILAVKNEFPELPIVGIGGINSENAAQVWRAGVSGIAVISAITKAENVAERISALKASHKEGGGE
ncbi:thiamine-phosphate pyrophosphorylase [Planococcus antarcticus DSM 14505]|uniref:Thiamine-phosphate synthase n=1 Tax=Planococcus antarcticus DSM 14505 TaxID=1185653 RepID=A0AA87IHN1_9BACL|nr:thiamine phosphate synthase [Planococcus antarcticus]EIM04944.1 thiamine-phosphate pyrophosphorylase [Planococcus antarcticus DSM 14505]